VRKQHEEFLKEIIHIECRGPAVVHHASVRETCPDGLTAHSENERRKCTSTYMIQRQHVKTLGNAMRVWGRSVSREDARSLAPQRPQHPRRARPAPERQSVGGGHCKPKQWTDIVNAHEGGILSVLLRLKKPR
jgi:hypothetical protein